MKKFKMVFAVCVAALAFSSFATEAQAQEDDGPLALGPIIGYQVDADDHGADALAVGLDIRFAIDLGGLDLVANPSIQTRPTLIGDLMHFDVGLNFLAQPDLDMGVDLYVGPGLATLLIFEDFADTVTIGLNGIVGANFDLDMPLAPFAQFRFNRTDLSDGPNNFLLEVGGHFGL